MGWNNIQKFIFAKQLLKGAARIFIRSQPNVKSWNNLKDVLNFEFGKKLSAVDIHKAMKNRKKKPN